MIHGPFNSGAAVGADGAATATAYSPADIHGFIYALYVKYNGDKPATTDVTISTRGASPHIPSVAILTLTDKNTDGLFLPRINAHSILGVVDASGDKLIPIADVLKILVAGANTDDTVDVWLETLE